MSRCGDAVTRDDLIRMREANAAAQAELLVDIEVRRQRSLMGEDEIPLHRAPPPDQPPPRPPQRSLGHAEIRRMIDQALEVERTQMTDAIGMAVAELIDRAEKRLRDEFDARLEALAISIRNEARAADMLRLPAPGGRASGRYLA